jgi:hypothetical protein
VIIKGGHGATSHGQKLVEQLCTHFAAQKFASDHAKKPVQRTVLNFPQRASVTAKEDMEEQPSNVRETGRSVRQPPTVASRGLLMTNAYPEVNGIYFTFCEYVHQLVPCVPLALSPILLHS